jgi:hypothetical protein
MPKPLDPDECHRAFIGIHVPRALRERLDREAATAGLTLSQYLRLRLEAPANETAATAQPSEPILS